MPTDPEPLLERARADVDRWTRSGIALISVLDAAYPDNLHAVHDRPALLFVRGRLDERDERSIAIVGSREPSPPGVARAHRLSADLGEAGYVIVSGLATGIDAAAHTTALERATRTLAVIGTGVDRSYPAGNAALQTQIADRGAVISCFWPDAGPTRQTFPIRNALMSGLTRATVIVEASATSGTRIQARRALAHGRPVFLAPELVAAQAWAAQLAERPNVHVTVDPATIATALQRAHAARHGAGDLTP